MLARAWGGAFDGGNQMIRLAGALAAAAVLAGCQTASSPPPTSGIPNEAMFATAKQAVLAGLKDPGSAQFVGAFDRRTKVNGFGQPVDVVCGRVNAKNSFGGYTGAKLFVYRANDQRVFLDGEGDQIDRLAAMSFCA